MVAPCSRFSCRQRKTGAVHRTIGSVLTSATVGLRVRNPRRGLGWRLAICSGDLPRNLGVQFIQTASSHPTIFSERSGRLGLGPRPSFINRFWRTCSAPPEGDETAPSRVFSRSSPFRVGALEFNATLRFCCRSIGKIDGRSWFR